LHITNKPKLDGQAAASRAEGGRWRRSQGIREAKVEKGAADEVGDEAAACSKAGDETAVSSKARDKAVACSGDRKVRALGGFEKLLCVVTESVGPKILGHWDLMQDAPLL
jgi:hypothetical protein